MRNESEKKWAWRKASIFIVIVFMTACPVLASPPCPEQISKKLGHWFVTSEPPQTVVFMAHGLNLKPQKMDAMAGALSKRGHAVFRVRLSGHRGHSEAMRRVTHKKWLDEMWHGYCLARKKAKTHNVPLNFVGFSLGGLLNTELLLNRQAHYSKMVLLAPGLVPRAYTYTVNWLKFLPDRLVLPNLALPTDNTYAANKWTSLAAYRATFQSVKNVHNATNKTSLNIPTRVYIDPWDELVSPFGLQEFIRRNHLSRWQIKTIDNNEALSKGIYNHIIIDPESLGPKNWRQLVKEMATHISPAL